MRVRGTRAIPVVCLLLLSPVIAELLWGTTTVRRLVDSSGSLPHHLTEIATLLILRVASEPVPARSNGPGRTATGSSNPPSWQALATKHQPRSTAAASCHEQPDQLKPCGIETVPRSALTAFLPVHDRLIRSI